MIGIIIALIVAVVVLLIGWFGWKAYQQSIASQNAQRSRNQIGAGVGSLITGILGEAGL